jgi:peptidoglycan/xylan/chitin deacetylase (PgdA/CDA1 family)
MWLKNAAVHTGTLRAAALLAKPRVVILMYHSVVEDWERTAHTIGTSHSLVDFELQMRALSTRFHPVSLDQVVKFANDGQELPAWSVAVTFDDGFADNYDLALPILRRYQIPATFYIMVNAVESGMPPWYIRLNFAFHTTTLLTWKNMENGRSFEIASAEGKKAALNVAWGLCAARSGTAQEEMVRKIEKSIQIEPFVTRGMMMNWDQVRSLRKVGYTVGAHTLSHPNLAHIPESEAWSEIRGCKERLEERLGCVVEHFSYPHPALDPHWSVQILQLTREAGFRSGVLTTHGAVLPGDQPLRLRRVPAARSFERWIWELESTFLGRRAPDDCGGQELVSQAV